MFHGRVADQQKSHLSQVMSPSLLRTKPSRPKRSSRKTSNREKLSLKGILGRIRIKDRKELWETLSVKTWRNLEKLVQRCPTSSHRCFPIRTQETHWWKCHGRQRRKRLEYFKKKTWSTVHRWWSKSRDHKWLWFRKPETRCLTKGQQTRRCCCKRDDQTVYVGEDLVCYEVFTGTLHGSSGSSKFKEKCETRFSHENLTRNQRKGSEVTGPSRQHQRCRSRTRLVFFCIRKKNENLKIERNCMLQESMGEVTSTCKCWWRICSKNNGNGKRTDLPCRNLAKGCGQQFIWQFWTWRRRSMKQDRGTWRKLWKFMTHTDGWLRPSCARCPSMKERRCLNTWRAISLSIGVLSRRASKPPGCSNRSPRRL